MKKLLPFVLLALLAVGCNSNQQEEQQIADTMEVQATPIATAAEQLAASVIDLANAEEKIIDNFKDGEGQIALRMVEDSATKTRFMKVRIMPHSSVGYHQHATSTEVIFFTAGSACLTFDSVDCTIHAGDCHFCPKGHSHGIVNNTDQELEFLSTVVELGE